MTDHVKVERDGKVMVVTLDRPDKKNALTVAMYRKIADSLIEADNDPSVRALVLTGTGDYFTAGNDLGDFAAVNANPNQERELNPLIKEGPQFSKPLIIAANGPAIGIGLTVMLQADLAIASERATFRAPFVNLGLVPEFGSSLLLTQFVGAAWANDILLAGRQLSAKEALDIGLVTRIYSEADLMTETMKAAHAMAACAPSAFKESKALIRAERRKHLGEAIQAELKTFTAQLKSDDFKEAMAAFSEKRPPNFG